MPIQSWEAALPGSPGPGAALVSSITLTDISPAAATAGAVTLPANFLQVGSVLRLTAWGVYGNAAATPTLLLGFYYGGIAGIALAATSAFTITTGATNWPWRLEWQGIVRSTGTAGSIMGQGFSQFPTSLTAFAQRAMPETAMATVAIDTTLSKIVTVGAQWGTSAAANTIQCHGLIAESVA